MKHSILWSQWHKCKTYSVASFRLQKMCVAYVICFPLSVILHWTPAKYFVIADENIYASLAMYQFVCSLKRNIPFGISYYLFQFCSWLIITPFASSHQYSYYYIYLEFWTIANPLYRGIFGSYFNQFNVSSNVTFIDILWLPVLWRSWLVWLS